MNRLLTIVVLTLLMTACQKEEIIIEEELPCEYLVTKVEESAVTLANGRTFFAFYGDDFRFFSRSRRFEVGDCIDQYVHQFKYGNKDFNDNR